MTPRGRRVAGILGILALVLAGGRWLANYRAERLWEAGISDAVAVAGAGRALGIAGLDFLGTALAAGWLLLHFGWASRIAFPAPHGRGRDSRRGWPETLPWWFLAVLAIVAGALAGSGLGSAYDHLRLALTGLHFGIRDPLADRDLGTFLGSFPFWSAVQRKIALLMVIALAGTLGIHAAGGSLRLVDQRVRMRPEVRGQLAVLLAALAAVLVGDLLLEPLRLAAGSRGPLLPAEFELRRLLAYLIAGLGSLAGVLSLLWGIRLRGGVPLVIWMMFVPARTGMAILPVQPESARSDPAWRTEARALDAVAFGLAGLESGANSGSLPALVPTLWDDSVMARVMETSTLPRRGRLEAGAPVWIGIREAGESTGPEVFVVSDDRTGSAGGPLFFEYPAAEPIAGMRPWRRGTAPLVVRPNAPRVVTHQVGGPVSGVRLAGWLDRLAIAWAWQAPVALSASRGTHLDWNLDPATRLAAVAPFARWSQPRLRLLGDSLLWQSDGILIARRAPSSGRVRWSDPQGTTEVALARPAFLGTIDAATGAVRIFQRTASDSLAAAWARVAAPLIEPPGRIPPVLRSGEAYPLELARAQALVVTGPAWDAGSLADGLSEGAGGAEYVAAFSRSGGRQVSGLLSLRRTPAGDSLRRWRFDPAVPGQVASAPALEHEWERFPFRMLLLDSIHAVGARFHSGAVRYARTADGVLAYQPGWTEPSGGQPRLALLNLALGDRLGIGRNFAEAWRNLRGETSPLPAATGAEALLAEVRRWWWYADSALARGDLAELGRALAFLRELLERRR